MRRQNIRQGDGENQFGVILGDLRKLAKKIKFNQELALSLWETGNSDARFLAIFLTKPEFLSAGQVKKMVQSTEFVRVAGWLNSYITNHYPEKENLRLEWFVSDHPMDAR